MFIDAVRRVTEGERVIDPTVVSRLMTRRRDSGPLTQLADREREVLALMAEGHSNQGISNKLFLSPKTVEATSARSSRSLGCATRLGTTARSWPCSPS